MVYVILLNQYAKTNNNCIKSHDKNKESSSLKYWDVYNLFWQEMLQKLSVDHLKWDEDTS